MVSCTFFCFSQRIFWPCARWVPLKRFFLNNKVVRLQRNKKHISRRVLPFTVQRIGLKFIVHKLIKTGSNVSQIPYRSSKHGWPEVLWLDVDQKLFFRFAEKWIHGQYGRKVPLYKKKNLYFYMITNHSRTKIITHNKLRVRYKTNINCSKYLSNLQYSLC